MSVCVLVVFVALICVVACTGAQIKTAVIDVDKYACIVAADEMGTSEPAIIAELCSVPVQVVLDALAKQKAARAMARDGGVSVTK